MPTSNPRQTEQVRLPFAVEGHDFREFAAFRDATGASQAISVRTTLDVSAIGRERKGAASDPRLTVRRANEPLLGMFQRYSRLICRNL